MGAYKDKNGTWYAQFRFTNWKGEADRKTKRGFATKKEALEWEREFLTQSAGNLEMTFEAFYELYKKNLQDRLKKNTWKMKTSVIESKILPYFKKKRMCDIKPRDIVAWQNIMLQTCDDNGEPYSPVYLKTIHNQISAIFNHAVKFYELESNPAAKVGNMGKEKTHEMLFWTKAEYLQFAEAIMDMLRRILNSKNEAIVILNNYFKGGVGKSKLSTMFAYLTDKFNLKVLMIDKDLQATLTKDLAKTFKVELPRVNFYEGLKNGNLASSIVHLTDNLDLIPGTFDLMLLPKLTRSWTFENESRLLATLLAPLKSDYDLIIIDTVPTPSVYTNNAIVASDYVMIPLQAEEESTNNIQNYISYLIDLQEQFNPGLDMIGFVPYLVDTDSTTIKSNLEELYKQHKEDNLVFQNIIKRSNKVSTWSKNGITEHKGYDKKVLSMYENVFFEMLERIIQLENEKEQNHKSQVINHKSLVICDC